MTNSELIRNLYRHMEWADAATWTSVLATAVGNDAKLRGYLYHLHMVQRAFLRIWRGEPRETPYPEFEQLPGLMNWARGYYAGVRPLLDGLNDDEVAEVLPVPWAGRVQERIGRAPAATTLRDTMLQVPLHSTYHRGQVNMRLREIGGKPPLVDYIAWIWLGSPQPDWPPQHAETSRE